MKTSSQLTPLRLAGRSSWLVHHKRKLKPKYHFSRHCKSKTWGSWRNSVILEVRAFFFFWEISETMPRRQSSNINHLLHFSGLVASTLHNGLCPGPIWQFHYTHIVLVCVQESKHAPGCGCYTLPKSHWLVFVHFTGSSQPYLALGGSKCSLPPWCGECGIVAFRIRITL